MCAADVNAICEYEGSVGSCTKRREYLWHSPGSGRSRPKHAVSAGLMTLTEEKRPEANWIIELIPYAFQCHSDLSLATLAEYWFVADSISDATPNSQIRTARHLIVKSY